MATLFVPYNDKNPLLFTVNGHKLLIVLSEKEGFDQAFRDQGATRLRAVKVSRDEMKSLHQGEERETKLVKIARRAQAGLVMASGELSLPEVIKNLEAELPWLH